MDLYSPVYIKHLKKYANQTITDLKGHKLLDKDSLMYEIVTATYQKYGHLNEFTLVDRTHANGTPWSKTYDPRIRNQTISDALIKEYFEDKVVVNAG